MENNKFARYHYSIWFPEYTSEMVLDFFENLGDIRVTNRFTHQIETSSVPIPIPTRSDLINSSNTLVEIYEILDEQNKPKHIAQKLLIRCHNMNDEYDYSYVCARDGFLISAWANEKTDIHRLISKDVYINKF